MGGCGCLVVLGEFCFRWCDRCLVSWVGSILGYCC